ncbi:MAG: GAF domain-containing protein, partial [Geodermatophilaceae bacterium]|nr:GAF domain-containing protein [Geodermatophilaceae bacterium]
MPTPSGTPVPPDGAGVAASRVRFLTGGPVEVAQVRAPILASWQRSCDLEVSADRIEMSYVRDPDLDTPLTRASEPVMRSLGEQLDGQSISIVLTDPSGLVLRRLTADSGLERHLDKVLLAPGFSYGEEFVGTNGIGTALEAGGPIRVFGHEHYAEYLENLACAGVPIQHPVSGRTIGALDLTCWRKDAGPLLLTLARTTADQIRQALLADTGAHQLELFQEYLRACRRMTGVVFAMSSDVVMLNDYARTQLDPADQAALLAQAAEAAAAGQRGPILVRLPTGTPARMYCRPVRAEEEHSGVVVHVKLGDSDNPPVVRRAVATPMLLPGLVGSAPLWLRACDEVERLFRAGEWLAIGGEPGVGKLAVLRAVQLRRQPVGRFLVLDAADAAGDPDWLPDARQAIVEDADSLVIRHLHALDGTRLRALSAALRSAQDSRRERPLWVAVTLTHDHQSKALVQLLQLFPSTVDVPPLRLHREDLQPLATLFLSRLSQGGHLAISPGAMRLLMRMDLPGNAQQLH